MFLSVILSSIRRWYRHRETVRQLSILTDRELSDIGIERSNIHTVARYGR
jgi:uncharacterized protein YjiS (DUF1127 family)